jgi:hypothetical protein
VEAASLRHFFRLNWPLFRPAAALIRLGGTPSVSYNMLLEKFR